MKQKNGDGLLVTKAYNARVIVSWLAHCLHDALQTHPDHETLLIASECMILSNKIRQFIDVDMAAQPIYVLSRYSQTCQELLGQVLLNDGAEWENRDTWRILNRHTP